MNFVGLKQSAAVPNNANREDHWIVDRRCTMLLIEDDTFLTDDDMPEEWLAQVFEIVKLKSRDEQTRNHACRANQRQVLEPSCHQNQDTA